MTLDLQAMGDQFGLAGKTILVVGGGAGIGERTALRLAAAGANVCVVDVAEDRASAVVEQLKALGVKATSVIGDVTNPEAVDGVVEAAWQASGPLDGCVTIVGMSHQAPLLDMPLDMWTLDFDINVRHVFLLFQAVTKRMVAAGRQGALACVTSVSGRQAAPNHAAYGAAKAGLAQLVKSMAIEWAPYGIRVNAVGPGTIVTPRLPDTPQRIEEVANSGIPMARRGQADEIAKCLLFMMSDLASYVTGHNLMADGGWMAANLKNRPGWRGP